MRRLIEKHRGQLSAGRADATAAARVLLVGINYWPEPTGIGPYTTALAEHLATRVQSVEVVTGLPTYPHWSVPPAYRRGRLFREERRRVAITRVKHYVPGQPDAARRAMYEASFLAHVCCVPVRHRPTVVVGVSPALAGAAAAAAMSARYGARLVLIVQDLVGPASLQSGVTGGRRLAGVAARSEQSVLRRADALVVVSDDFRATLESYGVPGNRIHTVRNWARVPAPRTDREQTRTSFGWSQDATVILHTGSMGFKQGLENVVEAARLAQGEPRLRWVLMGDGSQFDRLRIAASGLPNLEFRPLCSDADYGSVLDAADILLLNERLSVAQMSLPSKLTSYFSSGRPVAAAVRPDSATAAELRLAGAPSPVAPSDPAALLQLIRELAACPERCAAYGRSQRDFALRNLSFGQAMRDMEVILCPSTIATPLT
jgi:glycosyltransferase involved in cell wall biosynthesis